ncbi:MAG: hypothetical protein R3E96_04835 [Planctomycetota bacterium]
MSAAPPAVGRSLFPAHWRWGSISASLLVRAGEESVELATFRLDGAYADGRHPDAVRYTDSLEEDAARRDFTCNALYLDPTTFECMDPTGGLAHIAAGELHAVGEASRRFAEDGLRLLRVPRFLARFGWRPAPGLIGAMRASRASLRGVSAERFAGEMALMAGGPGPLHALEILAEAGLWDRAFSAGHDHGEGPSAATLAVARARCAAGGIDLADWYCFGLEEDWGAVEPLDAKALDRRLRRLTVPRAVMHSVAARLHARRQFEQAAVHGDRAAWIRLCRDADGRSGLFLARARRLAMGIDAAELEALWAKFESLPPSLIHPAHLPGGNDWQALGVPAGPPLGRWMRAVEDLVLRGDVGYGDAVDWRRVLEQHGAGFFG